MGLFTTLLIYDATKAGAKKVKKSSTLPIIIMMSVFLWSIKLAIAMFSMIFKLFLVLIENKRVMKSKD